jgi:hypothetical protein
MFLLLFFPVVFGSGYSNADVYSGSAVSTNLVEPLNPRVLLPVYLRLQALEKANVTVWESMPRNFTDHVAAIDSRVLGMFISSNSLGFNLSTDSVGNVWIATHYTLDVGDYVSTLAWVSSKPSPDNLGSLGFVSFPDSYPGDVEAFLEAGTKIYPEDQAIIDIAAANNQTQGNMTQTAKNVLDLVNTQGYDPDKARLLLSGNLTTSDMLDVFKDSLQVLATNTSICIERSWFAAAILRATRVPTRTVTDVRLKTWIQLWLPNLGWVDGETLCSEPPPHFGMLPKPISSHVPWVVENSSSAVFPFTWFPKVQMRVANLTFGDVSGFRVDDYKTILSQPVDAEVFNGDPTKFMFPLRFDPETIYGAVTREGLNNTAFSLIGEEENATVTITLGQYNSVSLGDLTASFIPVQQNGFLALYDFSLRESWKFDLRLLLPIVGVPVVAAVVWLYLRRRR